MRLCELYLCSLFLVEVQIQAHVNALVGAMKNKPIENTPSFLHEQAKQLPAQVMPRFCVVHRFCMMGVSAVKCPCGASR